MGPSFAVSTNRDNRQYDNMHYIIYQFLSLIPKQFCHEMLGQLVDSYLLEARAALFQSVTATNRLTGLLVKRLFGNAYPFEDSGQKKSLAKAVPTVLLHND